MTKLLEYSELMGDEYGEYLEALHWLAVNPLTDGHLKSFSMKKLKNNCVIVVKILI